MTLQRTLADAPTVAGSGFPGFDFGSWNGIMVPAKTPKEVAAHIKSEIEGLGHILRSLRGTAE